MIEPPETVLTLITQPVEINGVKIPEGRVAALNQGMIYRLAAEGWANESQAAIEQALMCNYEIIDPFEQ